MALSLAISPNLSPALFMHSVLNITRGTIWGPRWVWFWQAPVAFFRLSVKWSPACKLSTAIELERAPSGCPCLMDWGV